MVYFEIDKLRKNGKVKNKNVLNHDGVRKGQKQMRKKYMILILVLIMVGQLSGCTMKAEPEPSPENTTEAELATGESLPVQQDEETVEMNLLANDFRIGLIAMDRIDKDWTALEEGAMKAAEELGCEVVNLSPGARNGDWQAEQVSNAVSSGCDAIVIAADDSAAVSAALEEAIRAGVEVICVNAPADVEAVAVSFFVDAVSVGRTAGETMISELEAKGISKGSIGIIGIHAEDATTVQIETGFREAFEGKPYTLLDTRYSEGDAAKSHTMAQQCIAQGVAGIFACDESACIGSGNAAKEKRARVTVVGIGSSDTVLNLIEEGFVHASIAQDFNAMGYEGVKAACAVLNGKELGGVVADTDVCILTK